MPAGGDAPAVESGTASDPAVPAAADSTPAEAVREPAAAAARGTATTGSGDACDHGLTYAIEPSPQSGERSSGDVGSPHALANRLAAAKALHASGHTAEAASQAHEILQVCEALDAELHALTRRIRIE